MGIDPARRDHGGRETRPPARPGTGRAPAEPTRRTPALQVQNHQVNSAPDQPVVPTPGGNSVAAGNLMYRIGEGPTQPRTTYGKVREPGPGFPPARGYASLKHRQHTNLLPPKKNHDWLPATEHNQHTHTRRTLVLPIRSAADTVPPGVACQAGLATRWGPSSRNANRVRTAGSNPFGGPPITRSDKNPTKKKLPLGHIYAKIPRV